MNQKATSRVKMQRLGDDRRESGEDTVVVEEPMEIRIGKTSIAVTMRTPGHDDELTAGFLYTEGIIDSPAAVAEIAPCRENVPGTAAGNIIVVQLSEGVTVDLDPVKRNFYATSSCGICGKASIDQVRRDMPPVQLNGSLDPDTLLRLPEVMKSAQRVFHETGGLHAAALFSLDGKLLCLREDIGRHNAVDKVVGWAVLNDVLPLDRHVLMVSGRAGFEIVQKALAAGIAALAAVSAPSSLAVALAESAGMTLIGFLRGSGMNIYSGAERVKAKDEG